MKAYALFTALVATTISISATAQTPVSEIDTQIAAARTTARVFLSSALAQSRCQSLSR